MSALEQACELLLARHGLDADAIVRGHASGAGVLDLEVEQGAGRRWFRFHGGKLVELFPEQDQALPLAGILGGEGGSGGGLTLLAWRPGRRIALRRDGDDGPCLVKGYRRSKAPRAIAALQRVGEEPAGFHFPRLLGTCDERAAYRATWLSGSMPVVHTSGAEAFARIGEALGVFQAKVRTHGLAEHTALDELELLDRAALRAESLAMQPPDAWHAARARVAMVAPRHETLVAVHRDLHDGQLLVDGDDLGLLDLDGLAAGSPLLDVANLSAHLELRALQGLDGADAHGAEACARSLLSANHTGDDVEQLEHLRFYQATTFLRLSLLYALRPRWAHLSDTLLRYAERCLDELAPA